MDNSQDTLNVKQLFDLSSTEPLAEQPVLTEADLMPTARSSAAHSPDISDNEMTQTLPQKSSLNKAQSSPRFNRITPEDLDSDRFEPEEDTSGDKKKKLIIGICSGVLALLVVLIGIIIFIASGDDPDSEANKIIGNNVFVGGIDLSGKSMEDAKSLLHLKTDHTFSQKDMVVKLPGSSINLSPDKTGAALDVDAAVEAAYQCGKDGSISKDGTYNIALLPYLTLDQSYIQSTINDFCETYSSVLSDPVVSLEGSRPEFDPENPTMVIKHQVLKITLGTPEYVLDAKDLYEQVLDAYSMNQFVLEYNAPDLVEPEGVDADALYAQYCTPPQDAIIDPATYEITPEIYGYGFEVQELQALLDEAYYGETVTITFKYLTPNVLSADFSKDMFVDTLAQYQISSNIEDSKRDNNISLSCNALNDYVINAGDTFSFNEVIGKITTTNGYATAPISTLNGSVMGGGISQTASALYVCALIADLDIVERHNHEYTIDFCELGLDAMADGDTMDLRFRNNTGSPIRIIAQADGGKVNIEIVGVQNLDYKVEILPKIISKLEPMTSSQNMEEGNPSGYVDGDILQQGITGYKVTLYTEKYDLETGTLISSEEAATSEYAKLDEVVVHITPAATEPTPGDEVTEPTDTTDPVENTDPTESTGETTIPNESTAA